MGRIRCVPPGDRLLYLLLAWVGAMNYVLLMAATAFVLAVVLFWLDVRSRRKTGIPSGELFYQDLTGQPFRAATLCSSQFGISGKPDCVIRTADGMVPVELKNAKRPPARGEVYPNLIIQTPSILRAG